METTTVSLNVNGQQAQTTLDSLKAHLKDLEKQLDQTARAGQRVPDNLAREIRKTQKDIRNMQSATQNAADTLRRLDRATPKELNTTLRTLKRQLEDCQRGTQQWVQTAMQIRRVQTEIRRVNAELRATNATQSGLSALISKTPLASMLSPLTAITAGMAALTHGIKNAFDAYVQLDAAMTETQKYTGLTRTEVEKLNDRFKLLDTRTSIENLHSLAQEAGRLGITGIPALTGYVRAADQINVALADLGEGATQTIAQLGDIFKITPEMGVEKAMLSIGSTVNVLSQNCAAAKAPIVEFTTRIAGVGQQAGLTLPQIMAFGAALDKNKLNVEASSSALGQLIQKMFQEPAKIAKAAGMDVKEFTRILNTDVNAALLMFLERVNQLGAKGGMAVLAPMFKDASVNGVRLSQTISTLANEIDFLKWEQGEANKAFTDATSVTHEYELFNNTAAASVEKMKNQWHQFGEELGAFVAPAILKVTTALTDLFRKINNPDYVTEKTIDNLSGLSDQQLIDQIREYQRRLTVMRTKIDDLAKQGYEADHSTMRKFVEARNDAAKLLRAALDEYQRRQETSKATKDSNGSKGSNATNESTGLLTPEELKDRYDQQIAIAQIAYSTGRTNHEQYQRAMLEAEIRYYDALARITDQGETAVLQAQAKAAQARKKLQDLNTGSKASKASNVSNASTDAIQQAKADYDRLLNYIEIDYLKDQLTAEQYRQAKENALLNHLQCMAELTQEGTDERIKAEQKYEIESLRIARRRQQALEKIEKDAPKDAPKETGLFGLGIPDWLPEFEKQMQTVTNVVSTVSQSISNLFSQITAGIQAEAELMTANIERSYDTQIRAAEGNMAEVTRLEAEREQKIAQIKNEASQRSYGMQVTQAVADTATGALQAFMSALRLPYPLNFAIAPVASAMAIAAGAVQIANIKKQQQAAAAQGYADGGYVEYANGGYTRKGNRLTPAGIVHAGEWVAPKTMVDNPTTAPIIRQLETIRQSNRLPNTQNLLALAASSQRTTPNLGTVSTRHTAGTVPTRHTGTATDETPQTALLTQLATTLGALTNRLNEPFVTINTITGDHGIQQAQQRYNQLQQNKRR